MNFLQLVQRLGQEAGVSGIAGLATCQNQSGEMLRLVNWVNAAWLDIQQMHYDWFFLRQPLTFSTNTATPQQAYTPAQCNAANVGAWKLDSFRMYATALGFGNEMVLLYEPYDNFRNLYLYGTMRTNYTRPVVFSVDPQLNFLLGGMPDTSGYTIDGEYYTAPQPFVNDADAPPVSFRADYHLAIVYKALVLYGQYEGAPEAIAKGLAEGGKIMSRLEVAQLPAIVFGVPLV